MGLVHDGDMDALSCGGVRGMLGGWNAFGMTKKICKVDLNTSKKKHCIERMRIQGEWTGEMIRPCKVDHGKL